MIDFLSRFVELIQTLNTGNYFEWRHPHVMSYVHGGPKNRTVF